MSDEALPPPSEEEPPPQPPPRRKRRLVAAAGVALAAGASIISLGPGAPWIVDNLADGRRVWRLGTLEIDGVRGAWVGDLRAARVTLTDASGVWAEAQDISLNWRPLDLLLGTLRIEAARARAINILRQPVLTEAQPPRGDNADIDIESISVDELFIHEDAYGQEARFTLALGLGVEEEVLNTLDLELRRTDSEADRALARYRSGEVFALSVDIEGQAGGILSRALGAPDDAVRITGQGDGSSAIGEARFEGTIGAQELLRGATQWNEADWTFDGEVNFDPLPAMENLAQRIGSSVSFSGSGARAGAFRAHAETPFLAVDFDGEVDVEGEIAGPTRFIASTDRLSDIARETPFEFGAATLTGELRRANGTTAIRGTLDATELDVLGRRAHFTGPVEASLTSERFELTGNLNSAADAPTLFSAARLSTELNYDRREGRFTLQRARIEGDALDIDAQGWTNEGEGEFSGDWRIKRLEALSNGLTGAANGRWRAWARAGDNEARVWSITADGQGARLAGGPEIVAQLLGASPELDARMTYENGGLTVQHARVNGAQLRAAATGRIVQGQANLELEATARGPLTLGNGTITGAGDATGHLTGRLASPALTARAQFAAFAAPGVTIEQPVINFTLAPSGDAYRGHAELDGIVSGQTINAEADVGVVGSTLTLDRLVAQAAQLQATGRATLSPRGVQAQLALAGAIDGLTPGVTGRIDGNLSLLPETITLTAQIADARAGELFIRAGAITASGPYRAIDVTYDLRGRLRRAALRFAGSGQVATEDERATLSLNGEGALAGVAIATRQPITATWTDAGLNAALDVRVADGAVTAAWRERGRALEGSVTIDDAPLAPLAAIWAERAVGRIDGRISLANEGRGLAGQADVTLDDARFAGRQPGTLDMHIVGALSPERVQATIDAQSSDGLVSRFEANAPVETSVAPIRVALMPERRGRATWRVRGPAESLWAAARLQDQALSGTLDGEGEIEFGAGQLTGDGRIEIVDGRFEDKLTGVTLVDLDADVSIGSRGVNIERFTASDTQGGRLTATGGSANPREGTITVTVNNMRVANRPDARARASGQLTLTWEGLNSNLNGALDITEAEINIAQNPEAGIPTMDVIEINRPDDEDEDIERIVVERNHATVLDVRIRAPGRVFTRGRGVDAEWSLDLRLAGTSQNPRLFGEARSIRGTLALSGQPFEIENARIAFNGDPLDARIALTAQRDTADMTARINLSGTAADPDVTLTSDPPLPEDEILPQVLFGRSVADLSALEAAQIAAALASLSGRASFDLVDAARAAAGLDRFNVRQDEAGGFLVAGGVYLTRDVYVEVGRSGLGQASTRVEWTIRPRLVLVTSFLSNGDQRASIRWRRESD